MFSHVFQITSIFPGTKFNYFLSFLPTLFHIPARFSYSRMHCQSLTCNTLPA